jgi:hypothetical protein
MCEACGGSTEDACPWCDQGFQSVEQQVRWRRFRKRMQKISGTYSVFKEMLESLIGRLYALGTPEALKLADEGRDRLHRWVIAEPATQDRLIAIQELMAFNGRALDYFTGLRR